MTQVRANKIKYALSNSAFSVASLCIGGTLMQTFLGEIGLTDRIWLHASILQIAGVAGTMVFSHSGDRGNVFRRAALSSLPIAALYFFYIPLCVFPVPTAASFGIAAALGLVQTLLTGIRTICDFKFPYRIIPMEEYGSLLAWCGIAGGLSTMAVGALFGWLARRFPFPALMCWAFPAAAVLTALGALLTLSMKPVEEAAVQTSPPGDPVPFRELLREPVFYAFLGPNLLRGVASGVVSVLAATALQLGHTAALTTAMVSVASAAQLATCFVYGILSRRLPSRITVFLGSLLMAAMPLLAFADDGWYLPVYGAVLVGFVLVNYGVPDALFHVVSDRIAGPYNAWRMVIHTGGSVLGTFLAGLLPVFPLLLCAAGLQLVSGLSYLLSPILRKNRPPERTPAAKA